MRTAYKVRAYPDPEQASVLNRTFGCVRVVWNRTLAGRHARYQETGKGTSYRESDAALTAMKKLPELEWLAEVSSVPLKQALRHQHAAFQAFFGKRARYPRFRSRRGKQSATYTRSAFRSRALAVGDLVDDGREQARQALGGGHDPPGEHRLVAGPQEPGRQQP
jgi:putative transposase